MRWISNEAKPPMTGTERTLATLQARRASRGIASPDAMAAYLDGLLAEAADCLAACVRRTAAGNGLGDDLGGDLAAVIRALKADVQALRADLRWMVPGATLGEPGAGALTAMTRAMLRDVERAALCGAFRERCAGLASRLPEPDAARAALAELRTGLTVLGRALGTLPLSA